MITRKPGSEGQQGVDRGFNGTRAPLHLGKEEASLERGQEGDGEVVRVDFGRELSGVMKVSGVFRHGT